jgi:antitoxin MazE
MEAKMLIAKWGNSLAVRLPKALVEELGLKEGDEVRLVKSDADQPTLSIEKPKKHELLEKLRAYRGTFPADYKFDREEANRRGRWDDP